MVCLLVFGIVDRVRDVSVRIADIGRWELFIFIVVTCCLIYIHLSVPVMLGRTIGSETHQRWSYVFTMSSLGWIDCHDLEKCWIA